MARIRTIKPSFFRHEELQKLEAENPGKCIMLVFVGLWGHCDSNGVFVFNPKMLKLDILPFIEFDMADTLKILQENKFFETYQHEQRTYGLIPTFNDHQRLNGKEVKEGVKYPVKDKGSDSAAPVKHPNAQEKERSTGRERSVENSPKLHTFQKSLFFNLQNLKDGLKKITDLPAGYDVEYYHKRATKKNYQYTDWLQALSDWIREDAKSNVLNGKKKKVVAGTSSKVTAL